MRREAGFSLVELIVIMAIIGILLAIVTMNFSSMNRKSNVESQVKRMHSDLITIRAEALFQKRERAVTITGSSFSIYSSGVTTVSPKSVTTLKYPVMTAVTINFDTGGMADSFATPGALCVNGGTEPAVDSIIIGKSMLYMGKRNDGATCESANVTIK